MHGTLRRESGFTLIELLVVIAIIGLLSAIVLASLNTARNKGSDAAIQSDLDGARTQAELIRSSHSCYTGPSGACPINPLTYTSAATCASNVNGLCADPTINKQIANAMAASKGLGSFQSPIGSQSYAFAVQFATDRTKAWCVDSSGQSRQETIGATQTQATINAVITGNSTCN